MRRNYKGTVLIQAMVSYFLLLSIGLVFAPAVYSLQMERENIVRKKESIRFLYECTSEWVRQGKPQTFEKVGSKFNMQVLVSPTGNINTLFVSWDNANNTKEYQYLYGN